MVTFHQLPLSLLSLNSMKKHIKENWAPASILIVSKLMSNFGEDNRTRTYDPLHVKQVLYQLS